MGEKIAEIVLLILIVFIIEIIGIIGLNWLLFIKSGLPISFKEFTQIRLKIIISALIIVLIGDVLMIIVAYLR